jgi:hypothetical protein
MLSNPFIGIPVVVIVFLLTIFGVGKAAKAIQNHQEYNRIAAMVTVEESNINVPELSNDIFSFYTENTYYTGELKDDKGHIYLIDDDYVVTVIADSGKTYNSYDKKYIKIFQKILKKHFDEEIENYDKRKKAKKELESKKFKDYVKE